jgi:hypothetical protein
MVLTIPVFIVRSLKLRSHELYAVGFIFFLGLGTITAIAHFGYILFICDQSASVGVMPENNPIDITSNIELCVAIWAGYLPALRVYLRLGSPHMTQDCSRGTKTGWGCRHKTPDNSGMGSETDCGRIGFIIAVIYVVR